MIPKHGKLPNVNSAFFEKTGVSKSCGPLSALTNWNFFLWAGAVRIELLARPRKENSGLERHGVAS